MDTQEQFNNHEHNGADSKKIKARNLVNAPQAAITPLTIAYTTNPVSAVNTATVANGNAPTNVELILLVQSLNTKFTTLVAEIKALGLTR